MASRKHTGSRTSKTSRLPVQKKKRKPPELVTLKELEVLRLENARLKFKAAQQVAEAKRFEVMVIVKAIEDRLGIDSLVHYRFTGDGLSGKRVSTPKKKVSATPPKELSSPLV